MLSIWGEIAVVLISIGFMVYALRATSNIAKQRDRVLQERDQLREALGQSSSGTDFGRHKQRQ